VLNEGRMASVCLQSKRGSLILCCVFFRVSSVCVSMCVCVCVCVCVDECE
jgi:hypothetical protein